MQNIDIIMMSHDYDFYFTIVMSQGILIQTTKTKFMIVTSNGIMISEIMMHNSWL